MHVKGHWRIRVKRKTGRKGTQHNKGRAAVQKRTRVEEKGECGPEKVREGEIAGRVETVFLGIKDLLSGERAKASQKENTGDRFKGPD